MNEELHPEQIKALRKMSPGRRLEVALGFMEEMRQLRAAMLRAQHLDWPEERVAEALRDFITHGHS